MRNSLEDQGINKDFENNENAWCLTAAPQVCSRFRPAVSIMVHKQSDQLTNLTRGEASAHHQTAPLSSAKVSASSKRRHMHTFSRGGCVAEGGGVFTGQRVSKLEPLSPIFFFPWRSIAALSLFMTVLAFSCAQQKFPGIKWHDASN